MRSGAFIIDAAERLILIVLYATLAARIIASFLAEGMGLGNLLLLPSEGLVLVFVVVRRRAKQVSLQPRDWGLAVAASSAPMLVSAYPGHSLVPVAAGGVVLVTGFLVQLHAKISLGRSFGCVPANRGLKDGGPYRFVRHPMYAGYMVSHFAFALMNPSLWNGAMYAICTGLQIPRLLAEERILARDEAYLRYRALVRYRLFPGIF